MNPYRDADPVVEPEAAPGSVDNLGLVCGLGLPICLLMVATDAVRAGPWGPVGSLGMLGSGLALRGLVLRLRSRWRRAGEKNDPGSHERA